jgi:hypothetical protein
MCVARSGSRIVDAGNQSNFFKMLNKDEQDGLFNGLRVRMGVATGTKTKVQDIKNTLVWEQAKGEGSALLSSFYRILCSPCLLSC